MLKAIKNKQTELLVSLGMVLALLIGASVLMYFLEHDAQPESFKDLSTSLWWGINKYLATIGGEDVNPITPAGKFLGGLIAVLGVGLFALPAGIIASGFIEEIENKKIKNELINIELKLQHAFTVEYYAPVIKIKNNLNLKHLPRKWLSLQDIKYKMCISESDILKVCEFSNYFRLNNVKLNDTFSAGLEFINSNRSYGQFINRKSKITIINLYPCIQPFFGHFSMAIADVIKANYISNEKYSSFTYLKDNQLNMVNNISYFNNSDIHHSIEEIQKDINLLKETDTTFIFLVNAGDNEFLMQFNIGASIGDDSFDNGYMFKNKEKLNSFFDKAKLISNKYDKMISKHGKVGKPGEQHISNFIIDDCKNDLLMLHVNVSILKTKDQEYYQYINDFADIFSEK